MTMYRAAGTTVGGGRRGTVVAGVFGGLFTVGNLVAAFVFARWAGKGPEYVRTPSGGVTELSPSYPRSHLELADLLFSVNACAVAAWCLFSAIRAPQRNGLLITVHAVLAVAAFLFVLLSATSLSSQPLY
ncbi:hypothetical protein ACFXHA_22215 [Nocardia sp. NPDC059240]|uniref:hypothetical protein n=1 Tax=Nocardia sp. NPDC059240 TaxID=3346786 RepID=UPI00367B38A1